MDYEKCIGKNDGSKKVYVVVIKVKKRNRVRDGKTFSFSNIIAIKAEDENKQWEICPYGSLESKIILGSEESSIIGITSKNGGYKVRDMVKRKSGMRLRVILGEHSRGLVM